MPKKAVPADDEPVAVTEAPKMVRCKVTGFDNLVLGNQKYPKGSIVEVPAESFQGLKTGLTLVETDAPLTELPAP